MTYKGFAKGKSIELEQALPFPDGQPLDVSVEPVDGEAASGSPPAVLRALDEPPHVAGSDVDELERVIERGRIPVTTRTVFDPQK